MMESGEWIRGWLMGLKVPVVLMVGYRGYTRHGINTDTVATCTDRFLMAFNIPFFLIENDADANRITEAFEMATKTRQPVVVLVGDEIPWLQPVEDRDNDAWSRSIARLRRVVEDCRTALGVG